MLGTFQDGMFIHVRWVVEVGDRSCWVTGHCGSMNLTQDTPLWLNMATWLNGTNLIFFPFHQEKKSNFENANNVFFSEVVCFFLGGAAKKIGKKNS